MIVHYAMRSYACCIVWRGGLLQTGPQERTQNPHCIFGLLTVPDPALTNMARHRRKTRDTANQDQSENIASTIHIESRSEARVKATVRTVTQQKQ